MLVPLLFLFLMQQPPPQQPGRPRTAEAARQAPTAPPIAEKVDETPVVTHHEIQINGKTLAYAATAAQMPILSPSGETEAHIFYIAYTLDGVTDPSKRPPHVRF